MNIIKWENLINSKYDVKKITNINCLKPYLTNPKMYFNMFTVYDITETEIDDKNFYAAYIFDERQIAGRKVVLPGDSGWTTTVIFIESKDGKNISNYFMHHSNGMAVEEIDIFLTKIKIRELEKSLWKSLFYFWYAHAYCCLYWQIVIF